MRHGDCNIFSLFFLVDKQTQRRRGITSGIKWRISQSIFEAREDYYAQPRGRSCWPRMEREDRASSSSSSSSTNAAAAAAVADQLAAGQDNNTTCCRECGAVGGTGTGNEEEIVQDQELVHVEINGIFQDLQTEDGQDLSDISKFIGLDTEQPIVQIGNQVFAGTFEDTIGTSLFFTLDDDQEEEDLPAAAAAAQEEGKERVFDNAPTKRVEYVCKADKKLILKRVFLTPK